MDFHGREKGNSHASHGPMRCFDDLEKCAGPELLTLYLASGTASKLLTKPRNKPFDVKFLRKLGQVALLTLTHERLASIADRLKSSCSPKELVLDLLGDRPPPSDPCR